METIRFMNFFGVPVHKASNITNNVKLAYGESVDIVMNLPKQGKADAFTFVGNLAKGMPIVGIFGCKLEMLDERGDVLYTDNNVMRCFVNATGEQPLGPPITDPDEETAPTWIHRWLESGKRRTLRVTNTTYSAIVPLRFYSSGFKADVVNELRVTDSLQSQIEVLQVTVNRLVKAVL